MLSLSDDDIHRICNCVCCYLNGSVGIENEIVRKIVEENDYLKSDMVDVASGRYSFDKIRNFLSTNDGRGLHLARVVCIDLLPKVIELMKEWREENMKRCLRLERKIQKLKKGSSNDDEDENEEEDVSHDEDEEVENDADEDDDEVDEGESGENEDEDDDTKLESSEDETCVGEKSNNGGRKKKKAKYIYPIPGRNTPLIWED